jgi:hypothetical protein
VLTGFVILVVYGEKPNHYEYNLNYTFENRGTTRFRLTQGDVTIPLFMNTSYQTVTFKEVSHSYEIDIIDVDDNKGAIIGLNREIPPGKKQSFTASYTIISNVIKQPSFNLENAEGYSAIPNELVKEYCNFEVPQYPSATLENHLGDCDDQSILLITICRSLGIPAYLQVGIYINPNIDDKDSSWEGHLATEADGVGWHGWAMIYIPPWGWTPVDLTLTGEESGFELIKQAPEYNPNIIPVLNVSKQSYIGESLITRERIINSSLYVTVSNEAYIVYNSDNPLQNYILLGLGAVLIVTIGLMFISSSSS